jgi:hypothetical protein
MLLDATGGQRPPPRCHRSVEDAEQKASIEALGEIAFKQGLIEKSAALFEQASDDWAPGAEDLARPDTASAAN